MPDAPTIKDQVAEVGREVGLRRYVYPRMVADGRMTQHEADIRTARLEAAYQTLKWLRDSNIAVPTETERKDNDQAVSRKRPGA